MSSNKPAIAAFRAGPTGVLSVLSGIAFLVAIAGTIALQVSSSQLVGQLAGFVADPINNINTCGYWWFVVPFTFGTHMAVLNHSVKGNSDTSSAVSLSALVMLSTSLLAGVCVEYMEIAANSTWHNLAQWDDKVKAYVVSACVACGGLVAMAVCGVAMLFLLCKQVDTGGVFSSSSLGLNSK